MGGFRPSHDIDFIIGLLYVGWFQPSETAARPTCWTCGGFERPFFVREACSKRSRFVRQKTHVVSITCPERSPVSPDSGDGTKNAVTPPM